MLIFSYGNVSVSFEVPCLVRVKGDVIQFEDWNKKREKLKGQKEKKQENIWQSFCFKEKQRNQSLLLTKGIKATKVSVLSKRSLWETSNLDKERNEN